MRDDLGLEALSAAMHGDAGVELLPCPFCGTPGILDHDRGCSMAMCPNGFCIEVCTGYKATEGDAVVAWNTRATLQGQGAEG